MKSTLMTAALGVALGVGGFSAYELLTPKARLVSVEEPLGELALRFEYRNCVDARANEAAPVRRGEPGFGAHLDADGDGIGCETNLMR